MIFDKSECDYLCFRVTVSVGMILGSMTLVTCVMMGVYWLGGGEFIRNKNLGVMVSASIIMSLFFAFFTWDIPVRHFNDWVKREIDNAITERESSDF